MKHLVLSAKLALRNLGRNRSRSLSTLLAVSIGLIGLALLDGYIDYSMDSLRERVIRTGTGHVQVAMSPAYFDEGDSDPFPFMLEESDSLAAAIGALQGVEAVVPMLSFYAVAQAGERMETIVVRALPLSEEGEGLRSLDLVAGKELSSGSLLLGKGLAAKLGLEPGEDLSLFAMGDGGIMNNQSYAVSGVATSGIAAADAAMAFMDIEDAMALLGTENVPLLIVLLQDTDGTDALVARLGAGLPGALAPGLVARPWYDLSPYYDQASTSYRMVLSVAALIVLAVSLFSVFGTLMLSVMERCREIGTLRAFGTKRKQVLLMFLMEGLLLGAAGALAGSLVGLGMSAAINAAGGIMMPAQPGQTEAMRVFFTPKLGTLSLNFILVLAASVLGSFIPGLWAGRRTTAELLRSS